MDNIKPTGLVFGFAVALLLMGKPLSGSRGFGGLQFTLPKNNDMTAKVRRYGLPAPGHERLQLKKHLSVQQMLFRGCVHHSRSMDSLPAGMGAIDKQLTEDAAGVSESRRSPRQWWSAGARGCWCP